MTSRLGRKAGARERRCRLLEVLQVVPELVLRAFRLSCSAIVGGGREGKMWEEKGRRPLSLAFQPGRGSLQLLGVR